MANEYYNRLSEMNPGDLADGLAMEAEFDAVAQAFDKLPTPHIGGQGFDGPVRVGDAVNTDEAVSLGQLNAAIGEAVLLPIATYGNLSATAWEALPSNTYLLFGTGAQFSNTPYTLVAGSTYYLQVRHVIGGAGVSIYHDALSLASTDDATNVDLRRLFVRTGSTFANAVFAGWAGFSLKKAALTALESLIPSPDQIAYYTPIGAAMTLLTPFARTLLDDANAAAVLATLDIADLYKKRNILGAVSQSAGAPTGAILERGSNANGEYVKLADGTLICTRSISLNIGAPVATPGSRFRGSNGYKWIYPAVFVGANPIFLPSFQRANAEDGTTYLFSILFAERAGSQLATSPTIYMESLLSWSNLSGNLQMTAIGRWI